MAPACPWSRRRPRAAPARYDGRAHTREVKLACLFTQASLDEDGHPIRDPGSSSYLATFEAAARFAQLVNAEARRRGAEHGRQLVILGDGAVWILPEPRRAAVSRRHPDRRPLPRREHVHELATLATRLLRSEGPGWLAGRLAELDAGDIPALLTAGRAPQLHRLPGP